ncbi:MAG TPA: response regulator transcription factor [Rhodothermales bacterium]|nr:response regulator transcription factor [Rhodothermales bacterium]
MRTRVYIVDDHPIVRRGLRQIFERQPDFCVCGEADNVTQALLAIPDLAPDLVVTDLSLEGRGGLELTRQITAHHPKLPVLIISMHDEQLFAPRALDAGARGYIMKRCSDNELIHAAREVMAGRVYLSEPVHEQMEACTHLNGSVLNSLAALTDREMEVFRLIGEGFAPRHIADQLNLSVSTVEVYRQRIKEKLDVRSSPLLLRYAIRWCKDHNIV